MKIQENNQHDHYAQAASVIISIQQFKSSIIWLHETMSNCIIDIKRAMMEELENEAKNIKKLL